MTTKLDLRNTAIKQELTGPQSSGNGEKGVILISKIYIIDMVSSTRK